MHTTYESRYANSPAAVKQMDTAQLRQEFLIERVFEPDTCRWTYSHYDRYMAGGAMPVTGPLALETIDPLKSNFFLERRELGIINVGGAGVVEVDNTRFELGFKEALYIGKGVEKVVFHSVDKQQPARFYLNSTPAHHTYPTRKVSKQDAEVVTLGALETSNHRTINKLLVNSVLETCQLQMGMTELKPGSVWNTMPAHTHDRRMEVYFYFEVPEGQSVCHFMGQPQETRHIWMQNEQAVISPPWSVHSGAGTSNYTFIWGMAGENLDYGDMDHCRINELR
ncbi:4-deoxy-L-threo-5-hexosulose-uronate ketol-isomerase [Chitinophaga terrae (ex Kim and Jung 2007)]|uniref:4-deoxy-L-threo-5-hexosulose-uronate ketol-isomerase n=1 Tax=Chitinophaga terrae (ex Kim and Jung 2007) TaxID=408074 RepID=A0A1H4DHQ5_9BACT|nr:5-dehydro-4-deoxy-D-glucuronate isomerase [Chitinophaga terrae (ex Kim and Jung 2007)]GEP92715.1 4-deoxy-L-threo-5-hexosulose-uronate ketol-isomerase 1 [Chitinophaga terrae (ex Kim and Jung 2007)]SEA71970.1 4-deoxy-L-threo-5-hexosulose-uronate ketol-isomerase [Chitinophaga terrae (ex Kim and Jung 2007)]